MAAKKLSNPPRLAAFLEDEAPMLKNQWLKVPPEVLGHDHPDVGIYKVVFPRSPWAHFTRQAIEPEDYPSHVPFASLIDPQGGTVEAFLAVDATVVACPVFVWDAINGEGFFEIAASLDDFKTLLKSQRD